jgi:hypothetical protein
LPGENVAGQLEIGTIDHAGLLGLIVQKTNIAVF